MMKIYDIAMRFGT